MNAVQGYCIQNYSFYRASTARTLAPFSCWLPIDSKRNAFSIDTATPIRPIIQNFSLNPFAESYSISGQHVGKGYKGIIIRNNRKSLK